MKKRCSWVPEGDELYTKYHDEEWGVPVHDDQKWFEFLTLEGFQAGLSWKTILYKRENFRQAFAGFDPQKVTAFGEKEINRLLNNAGIIRNKLKILAAVNNAKIFLDVQQKYGSFDKYIWQFTDGRPIINHWEKDNQIPASTALSDKMSKEFKSLGFKFVGTTICYAHMQATGMVNDHTVSCFRHKELS
jgi:DNA-3-methyladenine glycosylase I